MTPDDSLALLSLDPAVPRRWVIQLGEPQRHYHTLAHIERMLADLPPDAVSREIVAAIWLHDIVYDPTASDNEERSAQQAAVDQANTGIDAGRVGALILGTKRHEGDDPAQQVLNDLDLAILGASGDAYDWYAAAIRREYAHVPEPSFATGRPAVLRHFLARPHIYRTAPFTAREAQARANLTREIERWETG